MIIAYNTVNCVWRRIWKFFVANSPRCLEWSSMVAAILRTLRELSEPCISWTQEPLRQTRAFGAHLKYAQVMVNDMLRLMTGSLAFLTWPPTVYQAIEAVSKIVVYSAKKIQWCSYRYILLQTRTQIMIISQQDSVLSAFSVSDWSEMCRVVNALTVLLLSPTR